MAQRFPEETIVALCSPRLADGERPIRIPEDLKGHTLIHSEVNIIRWREWLALHGAEGVDLERGPRFDRSFMAISAAVDSVGVCLESRLLVDRELKSGRLVAPFGLEGPKAACHTMMFLKTKANIPKVKAFREWIL